MKVSSVDDGLMKASPESYTTQESRFTGQYIPAWWKQATDNGCINSASLRGCLPALRAGNVNPSLAWESILRPQDGS